MSYRVSFDIDIDDARTPDYAAQRAWQHIVRPGSTANVFDVTNEQGETVRIDLQEAWENKRINLVAEIALDRMASSVHGWSPLQQLILARYENGEFIHITPETLDDCGDGVLRFLMVECSPDEDCLSYKDAEQRITTAIKQLCDISDNLLQ